MTTWIGQTYGANSTIIVDIFVVDIKRHVLEFYAVDLNKNT
jgi:hypothetical protein